MKKMILGVLLSIIGLVVFSTVFLAVFLIEHTRHWYEKITYYGLEDLFWVSVVFMLGGLIICVVETYRKDRKIQ